MAVDLRAVLRTALEDAQRASAAGYAAALAMAGQADTAHDLDAVAHAQDLASRLQLAVNNLQDIAHRDEARVTAAALTSGRVDLGRC